MKIGVIGSFDWNDYSTLIRKLTVEIEDWKIANPDDNKIVFVHGGSAGAENMVTEFVGKVEDFMRQKGITITDKIFRAHSKHTRDTELINSDIDKLIIFSKGACARSAKAATIAREADVTYITIRD